MVEGNHGETLPGSVPQEQDPQGKAHEDPEEPKVNRVRISHMFLDAIPLLVSQSVSR